MEQQLYGYVRVSAKDQCEDRQLIALREFPIAVDHIFVDKQSGKDFKRPKYGLLPKIPLKYLPEYAAGLINDKWDRQLLIGCNKIRITIFHLWGSNQRE